MRRRRRIGSAVGAFLFPAICLAIMAYFAYAGVMGPRGVLAWKETETRLALQRAELARIRSEREALERRIALLDGDALDPDLLEEVARQVLTEGRVDEVVVPRNIAPAR